MANAKEVLEIMRDVAKSRIDMLNNDVTFYSEEKKAYYLSEYSKKLENIERLIRRYSLRLVHSRSSRLKDPFD